MSVFKNKLVVVLTLTLVIYAFSSWYFYQPVEELDPDKLLSWIKTGYSTQFCKVVFPRIQDCVNIPQTGCDNLVQKALSPCLNALPKESINIPDSRNIYAGIASCFENNIHNEIVSNYLLDSEECRKKLS